MQASDNEASHRAAGIDFDLEHGTTESLHVETHFEAGLSVALFLLLTCSCLWFLEESVVRT